MTDFSLAVSGVNTVEWTDPSRPGWVSRVNPHSGTSMLRYEGTVGVPIVLSGIVAGVVGEVDANLSGRLFSAGSFETPTPSPAGFTSASGISSVQTFVPRQPGHHVLYLRRSGGGGRIVHVDVKEAT